MFNRLKKVNKNQKGFTLIELIVVIAITGLIITAVTVTIFQLFSISARSDNHMLAVRQVQNAGYWISHDAQMAWSVEPADESVDEPDGTRFPLTLTWIDWDGTMNEITYALVGGELQRSHSISGNTETSIVAQYIDSTQTICQFANGKLTLTVTATVGGWQPASETRTYEVIPRPGS